MFPIWGEHARQVCDKLVLNCGDDQQFSRRDIERIAIDKRNRVSIISWPALDEAPRGKIAVHLVTAEKREKIVQGRQFLTGGENCKVLKKKSYGRSWTQLVTTEENV